MRHFGRASGLKYWLLILWLRHGIISWVSFYQCEFSLLVTSVFRANVGATLRHQETFWLSSFTPEAQVKSNIKSPHTSFGKNQTVSALANIGFRWSRVIVFCWAFAILPAIPMMFNTTIEKNWENKTDCKCFYPIDDVTSFSIAESMLSFSSRVSLILCWVKYEFRRKSGWSGPWWPISWFQRRLFSSSGRLWRTISTPIQQPISAAGLWHFLCFLTFFSILQDTEESDSEDGLHHWVVPCQHLAVLPNIPQRHHLRPWHDQVVGLDLLLPPPQRHDPAAHLHPFLWEAKRGFCESDLLSKAGWGQKNRNGSSHLQNHQNFVDKLDKQSELQKYSNGREHQDWVAGAAKALSDKPGHYSFGGGSLWYPRGIQAV